MTSPRRCSRSGCGRAAVATLTYVYSDSTAVVGPLATVAEPHSYDLCEEHALRLTVPRGWEVLRHQGDFPVPAPQPDDLEALADAVREAARVDLVVPAEVVVPAEAGRGGRPVRPGGPVRSYGSPRPAGPPLPAPAGSRSRRGHLRIVPTPVE
ncbi:DUF3499 domain-containing protein [Jatrophihabitans sp. YIM 134969]